MLEKNFVSLAVVVPKRQLKSRHLFQANDSCKPVISFYSISAAHICSQRLIYKPGWPRTSQLGASCSPLATAAIRVVSVSGLKTNPSHSSCLKCLYDESVQLVLLSIGGRRCNWSYVRLISTATAAMTSTTVVNSMIRSMFLLRALVMSQAVWVICFIVRLT